MDRGRKPAAYIRTALLSVKDPYVGDHFPELAGYFDKDTALLFKRHGVELDGPPVFQEMLVTRVNHRRKSLKWPCDGQVGRGGEEIHLSDSVVVLVIVLQRLELDLDDLLGWKRRAWRREAVGWLAARAPERPRDGKDGQPRQDCSKSIHPLSRRNLAIA